MFFQHTPSSIPPTLSGRGSIVWTFSPLFQPFSARGSNGWTFSPLFPAISVPRVQWLDLQPAFPSHFRPEGPSFGPSARFFRPFPARGSSGWTFSPLFPAIFSPRVQRLDLQPAFPAISCPRVQRMDLQPTFPAISRPRVQRLDLQPYRSSSVSAFLSLPMACSRVTVGSMML